MGAASLVCLLGLSLCLVSSAEENRIKWTPADEQNRIKRQRGSSENNEIYPPQACPDSLAMDDDLLGFDFIQSSGLDVRGAQIPGVRKVAGSNKYQTAFGISEEADIRMPTSKMFPHGLPDQFSFSSTFRMTPSSAQERWNLVEIRDLYGELQFAITFDGQRKVLEVSRLDYNNEIQTTTFSASDSDDINKLFNLAWHKIQYSSTYDSLSLFVDCIPMATKQTSMPGQIDVNGEVLIGRKPNGRSATFDLQWLSIHCDPSKPERERCEDIIPKTTTLRTTPTTRSRTTTRPTPTTTPKYNTLIGAVTPTRSGHGIFSGNGNGTGGGNGNGGSAGANQGGNDSEAKKKKVPTATLR